VLLMRNEAHGYFVRKIGNVLRNVERYEALAGVTAVPKIYRHDPAGDVLDMQYVHGLDMVSYLLYESVDGLIGFLVETLGKLARAGVSANYASVYERKLEGMDLSPFGFTFTQLMAQIPARLPRTLYHGDFTLENIIYSEAEGRFYLIDPLTSVYDSYAFDLGKLQQDLRCGWFIRDSNVMLGSKLRKIFNALSDEFGLAKDGGQENDMLLITMLLRVYPYCKTGSDRDFIIRNVRKLWR
jgi:Phosphotransferase enzyme family